MACASPLCNFLSFFSPSKPPPSKSTPPSHLLLTSQIPTRSDKSILPVTYAVGPLSSSSSSNTPSSVAYPSLANANTLFFRSGYNVQVIVDDNEPEERLVGRFRREVMRAGIIQETKRRRYFENKQDEKKRRVRDAAKRNKRRRQPFRGPFPNRQEGTEVAKKDDLEEDNWELPEGGIPN